MLHLGSHVMSIVLFTEHTPNDFSVVSGLCLINNDAVWKGRLVIEGAKVDSGRK